MLTSRSLFAAAPLLVASTMKPAAAAAQEVPQDPRASTTAQSVTPEGRESGGDFVVAAGAFHTVRGGSGVAVDVTVMPPPIEFSRFVLDPSVHLAMELQALGTPQTSRLELSLPALALRAPIGSLDVTMLGIVPAGNARFALDAYDLRFISVAGVQTGMELAGFCVAASVQPGVGYTSVQGANGVSFLVDAAVVLGFDLGRGGSFGAEASVHMATALGDSEAGTIKEYEASLLYLRERPTPEAADMGVRLGYRATALARQEEKTGKDIAGDTAHTLAAQFVYAR